jgi:hypothetical protein
LTFTIANKPAWANFNSTTGRLAGTPGSGAADSYSNIRISVSDGTESASLPPFSLTVTTVNTPPTISGTPATTATVGGAYSFQSSASDADGDALTFSISNRPTWAVFNAATGRLFGTPGAGNVGTYSNIVIRVSDSKTTTALSAFSITVGVTNSPPQISGTPATAATVGAAYSFQPNGTDGNGDTLTYSIASRPAWASFNSSNGRLSGTPRSTDAGTYSNIRISVSDGAASAQLPPFSITVTAANSPPTISGKPSTSIVYGNAYAFQPNASDPNGDALMFTIQNKPSWASFNATTGRLQGTPAAGDVGTYTNIVISVSDGVGSASLPAFAIGVEALGLGSATLTWTPPTERSDGSPLNNLAGFRLYWGKSSGGYSQSVTINNPGITTYVIEDLAPGTYYFVATAFDGAGNESRYSNEGRKTIN